MGEHGGGGLREGSPADTVIYGIYVWRHEVRILAAARLRRTLKQSAVTGGAGR